jgi:putative transposase
VLRVLRDYEISQRRACGLIGVDPKTVRRERPPDHSAIRDAMKEVAGKRRRFGYRRNGIMLERQGMIMNHKKLYRLYREEGLSVRQRRGRKRARESRTPMPVPLAPGARWSMDFVSDTFGASRKFRILAINDDCCRENLCLEELAEQIELEDGCMSIIDSLDENADCAAAFTEQGLDYLDELLD